ncbi:hypothetical protein [Jiella avicenniae]|uniref:Hydroxyquinol 1,2-dioxygenase n=1 Tax=Jiella avicenniae TaxID=2907202 RepID=A0A9X1T4A1_9HYPH|nr:hypothetical protein [Jiella avicenniae]MCE7027474.1 hypothetical protein [Jiella avicenniae]
MRSNIVATSIFAAAVTLSAAASAQTVPGSDYFQTRADEASRADVAASGVYGGASEGARAYGFATNERVPGSDYGRTRANEKARAMVRDEDYRGSAGAAGTVSQTRVPGSDYGRTIRNEQIRDSVR